MWAVVINPVAGEGKGARSGARVCALLNREQMRYEIIAGTNALSTSQRLATFLKHNSEISGVISVGGDGLIHLVLQQVANTQIPFLVIPAGTGNDFARSLGWLVNEQDSEESLVMNALSNAPRTIDLGLVDSEWFGAILSTGFDSVVNERANTLNWPRGPIKYNLAMAQEIIRFRPRRYKITLEDRVIDTQAMLIAIGNGRSYGGGMKVCPNADLHDGLFDIMILKPVSTFEFLRVFPTVYKGTHINHRAVEVFRSRKIEIEADAIAYADGERVGSLPIVAECVPKSGLTWIR